MFREAKDILIGVELAEKLRRRRLEKKCDWKNPVDRALYMSQQRVADWARILPADRICPCCKMYEEVWVDLGGRAICLSCWRVCGGKWVINPSWKLGNTLDGRKRLNGVELRKARELRGLSREKMGRRLGVSKGYVQKMEAGDVRSVSVEMGRKIEEVIGGDEVGLGW